MNKRTLITLAGISLAALILGLAIGRLTASGGGDQTKEVFSETVAEDSAVEIWTCSMHPQIQQSEPGNCPICGMDLIPLEVDSGAELGPREMSMSEASRALAEIQTSMVVEAFPEATIRLVGSIEYDETRVKSLTARFPARIDDLFVNFTGIRVKKGEHLASVYSPELLTAQLELLSAYRANPDSLITRAAREKLRLWDLLPEQIDAIIERGEAQDFFVLKAPIGGVVVEKRVTEGDYVQTGQTLFKIVDLSVLWAYLDAYESDLPWLRFGQEVTFTVESFPGETFEGKIVFIEPEVDRKTRTVPVRVNVPNEDGRLKPGMFVRGLVKARLGEDGNVQAPDFEGKWISPMHPDIVKDGPGQCDVCGMDLVPAESLGYVDGVEKPAPLVVPASAVLRTGKRAVVYVEKPDTERPTYEGREIVLGPRAGDVFLVESGLEAGEIVVTNAAFKIDSSLQIQAKPSMMSGERDGSQGAIGDESNVPDEAEDGSPNEVFLSPELVTEVLPGYLALQKALANDDLEESKKALQQIMQATGHEGSLAELVHRMMAADSLEGIRRPDFETLSNAVIAAVEEASSEGIPLEPLYRMHCPMVYDDRGADWLQASESLQNPYFGAMMLKCGEVKSEWGVGNGPQADSGENTNTR